MLDSTKNDHQKQNASKEKSLPARRSKRLGRPIHEDEVNDNNDQLPHISNDNVQDLYEKVASSGESGLRDLFLKLKQRFEGSSEGIGDLASATPVEEIPDLTSDRIVEGIGELPIATPVVSNYEEPIKPSSLEKTPITSPQRNMLGNETAISTNMSGFSTPKTSSKDPSPFVRRRRIIQGLYRSTQREAKERKLEGKKAYVVEVIDGEPTGPNASRWSSELGTRIRSYLDVTKSTFTDQDPRNVDLVIQQMENVFETVGGRISVKYYKYRMRVLMNNFRHKCRKLILDGKDRESSLTPKQWEDLKESMHDEDFLEKSARGKKGRNLVKDRYFLGRGGLRAKQHICVSIWCFC